MSTIKCTTLQNLSGVEVYTCKAWVNFNGTGTVAIRASGNVSSITDNGVGDYTVNFNTAMSDANYSFTALASGDAGTIAAAARGYSQTTTAVRFQVLNPAQIAFADVATIGATIFR